MINLRSVANAGKPAAEFGQGNWVVGTGTAHGKPAVFVAPAKMPGVVGTTAARENNPHDRLVAGEWFMTFPTMKQAQLVADALCNQAYPAPQRSGSITALEKVRSILTNGDLHETTRVVDAIDAIDATLALIDSKLSEAKEEEGDHAVI